VGYTTLTPAEQEFRPPSWRPEEPIRRIVELPRHATMLHSRAHLWRYPPGARGRLHREHSQEEVFVVVDGTPLVMLGDPPTLHEAPPRHPGRRRAGHSAPVAERQRRRGADLRLRRPGRIKRRDPRELRATAALTSLD
jgi:hypothetical protein